MLEGSGSPDVNVYSAEPYVTPKSSFEVRKAVFNKAQEKTKDEIHPTPADVEAIESRARAAAHMYRTERDRANHHGEMRVSCENFHEALERTMELMGFIPPDVKKTYIKAKFDPTLSGARVGFTAAVRTHDGAIQNRVFRFDNDPNNGPHINVLVYPKNAGKNSPDGLNVAFEFPQYPEGARETVPRMVELTGMYHGYKQQQV